MDIKNTLKGISKVALKISLLLTGVLLLLILSYIGWWSWQTYKPLMTKKFDSYEWKLAQTEKLSDGYIKLNRRCGMYHDLVWNHIEKGMTIKQMEEMLGEFERWGYCQDEKVKCTIDSLGVCYSNALTIVPVSLFMCFNEEEKLVYFSKESYCETTGLYNIKTREQVCWRPKPGYGEALVRTNDCGIDPW
jgi:hypothetical protein